MLEWLALWGVSKAVLFVFRPILEDLAKDVAKDIAKSYVKSCFKNVFSSIYRKPLAVATGRALKELLEQIQNELLDADLEPEQIEEWIGDVTKFTKRDEIRTAIASLFLDPDYKLDPATFVFAWKEVESSSNLPDDFSWNRVSKRFARKVIEIRNSSGELKETFNSLRDARMSDDIHQLVGLPPDFDLETYREALIERYGNLNFEMLDTSGAYYNEVRLWSVFVPQSVRECLEYYPQLLEMPKEHLKRLVEKGEVDEEELRDAEKQRDIRRQEYASQPLRPVLEVTGDSTIKRNVILGDPGSGKSSLLRFLALQWALIKDANRRYTEPLPLLIELREYNRWDCPNSKSFLRYLHEAQTWHRLNQQTLDHLLKQQDRVMLLLDGLDEIFDSVQRERVLNDIHRFSNNYPQTTIILTSRVVGYKPQRLRDAEFRHFMLQDLDEKQIDTFLEKWHDVTFDKEEEAETKRERLSKAIKDSKSIAMLAGNPLLLTMMAILNRYQELPRDRAELYSQASRVLLHQWDTERALADFPGLSAEIGLKEKIDLLRCVAKFMQQGPGGLAGNIISESDLADLIEDYLQDELQFTQAKAVTRAVIEQLRARNFILCFLGAESYAFVHRTFLEYFCATEIVHRFNVEKSLDIDGLITLFDEHCRDDEWREVLRLICGQIDELFVGRIVKHLTTRTDLKKWNHETLLPELPLAIWCLSEAKNLNKLENEGSILLESVVHFISEAGGERIIVGNLNDFLKNEILKSTTEIGERWPRTEIFNSTSIEPRKIMFVWGREIWSKFVLTIQPEHNLALELCESDVSEFRAGAYLILAKNWPDVMARELLEQRAINDEDESARLNALNALVENWPVSTLRKLIEDRAVNDEIVFNRRFALEVLSEKLADSTVRYLLKKRARIDGVAASVFGKMHSEFGSFVFMKNFYPWASHQNPEKSISRKHIEQAAEKTKIPDDKIDETVRSLSEHMGWDITKGSGG